MVLAGVGVVSTLLALVGLGLAAATRGHWGTAMSCLAAFAVILFLLLAGIEYADTFWEGK